MERVYRGLCAYMPCSIWDPIVTSVLNSTLSSQVLPIFVFPLCMHTHLNGGRRKRIANKPAMQSLEYSASSNVNDDSVYHDLYPKLSRDNSAS